MTTTAHPTAERGDRSGWPLLLDAEELAEVTACLDLAPDPLSPVRRLVEEGNRRRAELEHPGVRSLEHLGAEGKSVSDTVLGAVSTLSVPRRLLVVQSRRDGDDPIAYYLDDGERLVRFLVSDEDSLVSRALSQPDFVATVCARLGVPDDQDEAVDKVSDRFLLALGGLLDAGLATRAVPLDEALAAIAPAVTADADIETALAALAVDGVIDAGPDGVVLREPWARRFSYLIEPPELVIHAVELVDAHEGRWRPRTLAVLGATERRVGLIPRDGECPEGDLVVSLRHLSVPVLAEALGALLAPPPTPPTRPVVTGDDHVAAWLRGDGEDDPAMPAWTLSSLGELADDAQASASAIARPGAVIEIVHVPARTPRPASDVLAASADEAAEWTMDGSLIRWRALDRQQLAARVRALLPETAPATAPAFEMPAEQLAALMDGVAGDAGDVPVAFRRTAADPDRAWYLVMAQTLSGTTLSGEVLTVLASPQHGTWRFDPAPTGVRIEGVDHGTLLDQVADALGARPRPLA